MNFKQLKRLMAVTAAILASVSLVGCKKNEPEESVDIDFVNSVPVVSTRTTVNISSSESENISPELSTKITEIDPVTLVDDPSQAIGTRYLWSSQQNVKMREEYKANFEKDCKETGTLYLNFPVYDYYGYHAIWSGGYLYFLDASSENNSSNDLRTEDGKLRYLFEVTNDWNKLEHAEAISASYEDYIKYDKIWDLDTTETFKVYLNNIDTHIFYEPSSRMIPITDLLFQYNLASFEPETEATTVDGITYTEYAKIRPNISKTQCFSVTMNEDDSACVLYRNTDVYQQTINTGHVQVTDRGVYMSLPALQQMLGYHVYFDLEDKALNIVTDCADLVDEDSYLDSNKAVTNWQ